MKSLEEKYEDAQSAYDAAQADHDDTAAKLLAARAHLDAVEETISRGPAIQSAWPAAVQHFTEAYGNAPDLADPTDSAGFMPILEAEVRKRLDRTMSVRAHALIQEWTQRAKELPHD